jgi:hypothetical protein
MAEEYWEKEEFEDLVSKGLIAMYEDSYAKKFFKDQVKHPPSVRITKEDLSWIRSVGPYFAPGDRICTLKEFDIENDGIPDMGMLALGEEFQDSEERIGGYLQLHAARRIRHYPPHCRPVKGGIPYQLLDFIARKEGGFVGIKSYVTLHSSGEIFETQEQVFNNGIPRWQFPAIDYDGQPRMAWALGFALHYWADRKFLWNVQCLEHKAKASFGVYSSQIKSLFYARENPLTSSGRRRPILHWVSSHRRRIKEGHEVDIGKHLRGISEFEMDGTLFKITRPMKRLGAGASLAENDDQK